ncbi:hypothetical protein HPB51_025447 [Rhipicephalus microplus]|uniref:Fibronectin type-III domain-containing protein n=1 Tax=Rhipicephalus microplus TaxID=6941 RepID=A0A9J6DY60_RHIMP|nr:hypothetical protein HPB51_025447 [Rhipicephalus microplus]
MCPRSSQPKPSRFGRAFRRVASSQRSLVLVPAHALTQESRRFRFLITAENQLVAPVAPDKSSFLVINSTFVLLHLGAWYSGGCHISFFVAQYKPKGESEWTLISNHVQPQTETLMVPQLQPGTWYNLLMTAHNDAGSTDAEFVFATYTESGGTVPPLVSMNSEERRFYRHLGIVVPVACSAGEDDRSRNSKTGSRDMVDMVLLSKKLHSSFDETNAKSFYPSPPRLTQCQQQSQQQCLSAAQSAGQLASVGQEFDDANSDCDSVPSNSGGATLECLERAAEANERIKARHT